MTRSNKPKSKGKTKKAPTQPKLLGSVIGSLFNATILAPPQTLVQMSHDVLQSLNRLINGTANQKDWMRILHRITVGSFSFDTYFNPDPDAQVAFNRAWQAMVIIQLRAHLTGELKVGVLELDSITQALSMTDEMHRAMSPGQVGQIYNHVEMYYDQLVRDNIKFYPPNWKEVAAMEKKLAAEHAAAMLQPDPLKEAA